MEGGGLLSAQHTKHGITPKIIQNKVKSEKIWQRKASDSVGKARLS